MKVRLTRAARADLFAQLDWLADRAPQAARRASQRIRAQLAMVGEFPYAAREVADGLRDAAVRFGRDGFVVRYRVEGDTVVIIRMFHGRQRR